EHIDLEFLGITLLFLCRLGGLHLDRNCGAYTRAESARHTTLSALLPDEHRPAAVALGGNIFFLRVLPDEAGLEYLLNRKPHTLRNFRNVKFLPEVHPIYMSGLYMFFCHGL